MVADARRCSADPMRSDPEVGACEVVDGAKPNDQADVHEPVEGAAYRIDLSAGEITMQMRPVAAAQKDMRGQLMRRHTDAADGRYVGVEQFEQLAL